MGRNISQSEITAKIVKDEGALSTLKEWLVIGDSVNAESSTTVKGKSQGSGGFIFNLPSFNLT